MLKYWLRFNCFTLGCASAMYIMSPSNAPVLVSAWLVMVVVTYYVFRNAS